MRVLNFVEAQNSESLAASNIFAMRQWWREGQLFAMTEPRTKSALLWASGCEIQVMQAGKETVTVPQSALLYIPQGSVYSLRFFNRTEGHATVLLEFSLSVGEPFNLFDEITLLEPTPDPSITDRITKVVSEFYKPERNYFEIKSSLFKLLSLLCRRENQSIISEKFPSIERGIKYLESDDKQSLSLDEVAKLCFVTPAYFRRAFRKYAGMSPLEYRNKRKIERAKELLDSTDLSIADVSDALGYENPSYFCRAFKRDVGIAPTLYRSKSSIEK